MGGFRLMNVEKLRELLNDLQSGRLDADEVLDRLRVLPYEDLEYARLDLHRELRQGLPEVVFCESKTVEQAVTIFERLWEHHDRILGTRVSEAMARAVRARLPQADYYPTSRLLTLARGEPRPSDETAPYALVLSAGTADIPVAEEAAQTLDFFGSRCERAYDVGVAGLHRLLDQQERLQGADVIISVAGMEGALTSVVAGLVACPVVGVPTSVGYGASFGGLAALLAMLNSCAPGVAVVNIDNGFGAAIFARSILGQVMQGGRA
jgi:NCAIR mutase (PurE)-related protein